MPGITTGAADGLARRRRWLTWSHLLPPLGLELALELPGFNSVDMTAGLEQRWRSSSAAALDRAPPELDAEPDWELVAEHLNAFLGCSCPAPSWDGQQAATVTMCLSLAQGSG